MHLITIGDRVRRADKGIGVALALVAGVAISGQARINGQLAVDLGDSMLAAAISFTGGLAVLALLLPVLPRMRAGVSNIRAALGSGTLRPWHLLGGLGGALMITGQAVTVGVLGVATFTVGVVAGQAASGLVVDRAGLGPAGPRPLSAGRIVGAVLMLVAVVAGVWGGIAVTGTRAWLMALPLLAGLAVAVQQAINGRVGAAARNAMTATLVNFTVGATVLCLAWGVSYLVRGGPEEFPPDPVLYLGGLVGVAFIALAAFVVRWIGVLMLGLASIAGQLIGSLVLDVVIPTHGGGLAPSTIGAVAVALVAIGIAALPIRRRS
ncbi:MAG: DMT family transporter [Haloechinothrix sp.]